jgi:hypothetical protein
LELTTLLIENISLPSAVEEALDRRGSMGVVGDLAAYTQFNTANSIPEAARNPGGLAASAAGIGMGIAMAGPIAQAIGNASAASAMRSVPPPIPNEPLYYAAVNGRQTGPFDLQSLSEQIASGKLTRQTLVWTQGMPQWSAAGQVSALANLFVNAPPPIPDAPADTNPLE